MLVKNKFGVKTIFERCSESEVIISSEYEIPGLNSEERFIKFSTKVPLRAPLPREFIRKFVDKIESKYAYARVFLAFYQQDHVDVINNTLLHHGYRSLGVAP